MKQEVKPVVFVAIAALTAVVGFVIWRLLSPPVDAALLESRAGPRGTLATPPGAMVPGPAAPKGAGPRVPPGAMVPPGAK